MPTVRPYARKFGRGVQLAKINAGITTYRLSLTSGINESALANICNGRKACTLDTAVKISEAVGVSIDTLIAMGARNDTTNNS